MHVLLVSTYELGRQPFGLASPAAWLREAGHTVTCLDLSRQPLDSDAARAASLVAFYLPMHTATRLALPVIEEVRRLNPEARLGAYGLYAPLNADLLRGHGVSSILGGEFEDGLVRAAAGAVDPPVGADATPGAIPKFSFRVPDRSDLPPLAQYASLRMPGGERRVVGYTEASRGCRHVCRHCPVVPVYNGQFRVVGADVVLADIAGQVARGAQHITFGDPDFFNGVGHALRIVERLARDHPGVTYDVTVKIEHLLQHAAHLSRLRETGCLFVTSAAESVDDEVLARLDKGHTRADLARAVHLCRGAGLTLSPTFVPFTPWTTLEGYRELLRAIETLDLIEHVAPVQLAIRLLLPAGSRLLDLPEVRDLAGPFDAANLAHTWAHADTRVDRLQRDVGALVAARAGVPRRAVFDDVWALAYRAVTDPPARPAGAVSPGGGVPHVDEPWYCCAEPLEDLARQV
jgi:radical SAM superfamily enzyme YgiQ (UPF0313 family)